MGIWENVLFFFFLRIIFKSFKGKIYYYLNVGYICLVMYYFGCLEILSMVWLSKIRVVEGRNFLLKRGLEKNVLVIIMYFENEIVK